MPKISQKQRYLDTMCKVAAQELIFADPKDWSALDDAIDEVVLLTSIRYGIPRNPVPKSDSWYQNILPNYNDEAFQQFLRVSRPDFWKILCLIENHPVFHSSQSHKQVPVEKQLAITLFKLGSDGTGSAIHN